MAVYRLTPQRVAALAHVLRSARTDGVMRVERDVEVIDSYFDYDRVPRFREKTTISIELEVYNIDDLIFLEEDGFREAPTVRAPSPPPRDYREAIETLVDIVKVVVRAWAADDNRIRFGLLELD